MKLIPFLLINLGAFAILHFAWLPSAERRLRIERSMAAIRRGAIISLLGFARSVFLIATLTTGALIITVFILQMFGGVTATEVTSAIERIHRWRAFLLGIGPVWGGIAMALLVLALGFYARRSGRLRMEKTFQKLYDKKLEQLRKDLEFGKLKELPPTGEMRQVARKLGEINELLAEIERGNLLDGADVIAARKQLIEQADMLQKYYLALDVQRRLDLELDPDEVALPEARTKWEKVQTFFMSRGLLASLNKTSRALFVASLILLVPSLTSIYSISTASTLDSRLVKLQDLRVELSRKEFEQEKARLGEPTNELSEEDKQELQDVARIYEQMAAPIVMPSSMRASMYTMRSTLVRNEVLAHAAKQANVVREQDASSAVWEQHDSGSKVADLTPLEREVVIAPEKAIRTRGPVTPQGQRVYTELEDLARRSPSFMEKVRAGLRNFQRPASSYNISYAIFNQMAGTLAGELPGEFGNVLQGFEFDSSHGRLFKGFTEMQSRQFLLDLTRGTSLDEALRRTAASDSPYTFVGPREKVEFHNTMRTVAEGLPVTKINEKLADYPPSIDVAPENHVNMQKASDAVNRFRDKAASIMPMRHTEAYADAVANFSDWFPSQLGAEARTKRGELLAKWGEDGSGPNLGGRGPSDGGADPYPGGGRSPSSGGGGGGFSGGGGSRAGGSVESSGPRIATPSVSRSSFVRARSFGGLRGFSRVGGVLIGQTPTDAATAKLDFVDFRWEINGSNVRFILVRSDGQQIRSRPYRMSVAYQALNYAADGRPLAVTMASAQPLFELKILLHPTLVDTPLGHRVIELDRFVDTYTGMSAARKEAEDRVKAHHLIYSFAWAARAVAFLEAITEGRYIRELEPYKQHLSSILYNEKLRAAVTKVLPELPTIGDPQKSPLTVKEEFYDQTLVEMLTKLRSGISIDALSETIRARARQEVKSLNASGDEEKLKALFERWMSEPPEFEVWSGVRERDFDANLSNILFPDGSEVPVPFDFMLQIAFTSPPSFGKDANTETYTDTQPWEFPALGDMIQKTVTTEVQHDKTGRARSIVADVSEFTMLQRLFRMAFNGHLGEEFPVEKMMELSDALSVSAPKTVTRTLRWNARGVDPMASLLNQATGQDRELLTIMEELREALGVAKDGEQALREFKAALPPLN